MPEQPPRQIVEIVGALAQDRIAQALDTQAGFVLHALHPRFRGQTGAHRITHALAPALVIGEQPIGLDDLPPFACQVELAGGQHLVDGFAQATDGRFQPSQFVHRIVGDHALDLDARLVQHDTSYRHAFRQAFTDEFARPVDAQFRLVEFGDVEEAALRHHFRQHHGDGLQSLDLLLGIDALGLVLHGENAEHLSAAHDGHAQEGFVRVFTGFRTVGEMRVAGRVRQVDRFRGFADQTDQAFALFQAGVVDGGAVEAFGGEQFQDLAGAAQIDGADFRHHVGGDDGDELVQPHLGASLLRHDLAQAAQKQTWPTTR